MGAVPPLILLVDDEVDLTATCQRLLMRQGYRVMAVGSVREGLETLRAGSPALLLSDVRLPDGSGLDLVRAAGALEPPVPAIVMSGHVTSAGRAAALAAGARAYLAKPFTAAALGGLVDETLAASRNGG